MPRRLVVLIALALSLCVGIPFTAEAGGGRRVTGNGGTLRFSAGERVAGEIISLWNPRTNTWGRTWYRCKLADPARRGKVTSGVVQYYASEVKNLPNCKDTLSSPTPRKPTGSGTWRSFKKGDHVLGYAIETNGRTYFECGMTSVGQSGRVVSGVVNPSRFELRAIKRCSSTNNWRPGYRTASSGAQGDQLQFNQGDYIVAAYIKYADGNVANNGNACHTVAPQDGTLFGGTRNFWPGEQGNLPHC